MNLYILVEGRRTELRVYPEWLGHLLPHYSRAQAPDAVTRNNYFLISGEGYPRLLDVMLPRSIEDINACGRYSYFIICLDADDASVQEREQEVVNSLQTAGVVLDPSVTPRIIVQNRTFETWCLGNRAVFSRNPAGDRLRQFVQFYDVSEYDPEGMGVMDGYDNHAECHHDYLRDMLRERNVAYTKRYPRHVVDLPYLNQLISRVQDRPQHLVTLQTFLMLCRNIYQLTRSTA